MYQSRLDKRNNIFYSDMIKRPGVQRSGAFVLRNDGRILVEAGVEGVEVLLVELILCDAEALAEALVVDDLALAQELDGLADIGIVDQPQDIVVGRARLLFCCTVVCANFFGFVRSVGDSGRKIKTPS